jgi:hypothetical protein
MAAIIVPFNTISCIDKLDFLSSGNS